MKKEVVQLLDAISQRERSRRTLHGSSLQRDGDFDAALRRLHSAMDDFEHGLRDEAELHRALDNAFSLSRASATLHNRFLSQLATLQSRIPFDISTLIAEETVLSPKTAPWNLAAPFDA